MDELYAQGVAALARSCDTQHEEHWCPKYNTRIDSSWVDIKLGVGGGGLPLTGEGMPGI